MASKVSALESLRVLTLLSLAILITLPQQLRQLGDIGRDPPRLVLREQLGRRIAGRAHPRNRRTPVCWPALSNTTKPRLPVRRLTTAAGSGGLKLELPLQTTTVLIAPTQRGRALQLAAADAVRAISSAILLSDIRHRRERPLQQTVE